MLQDFVTRGTANHNRRQLMALRTLLPGQKVGVAGDSILAGAGFGIAGERFARRSQKFRLAANRAAGGVRTDQIAAQLPNVIADGATACLINGGINRLGEVSLVLANGPLRWHQRWAKALFDYSLAIVALIVTAPLMLAIAFAIRAEDGGAVFFRQDRIGLGNRPFRIWKFRTMRVQFSDHLGVVSTMRGDQRVTTVGRFLRRTSLDELPQLFNVLAGQMSLVGPRPHAAASRAQEQLFWDIDQRYWHRHSVRPGMTGLAQVRGLRGATEGREDLEQRLFADLEYVATWSLLNDLRIIGQTFSVLFHRNAF